MSLLNLGLMFQERRDINDECTEGKHCLYSDSYYYWDVLRSSNGMDIMDVESFLEKYRVVGILTTLICIGIILILKRGQYGRWYPLYILEKNYRRLR